MSVIQMTDDLYNYIIIHSSSELVKMNEIVLEIVFHQLCITTLFDSANCEG